MKSDLNNLKDVEDLLDEIKSSIDRDTRIAIRSYIDYFNDTNTGVGFFAIPRILFPEIDNLGSYLLGNTKDTSLGAITFLKKYLSQVNSGYKDKGAFIYCIYRHGLMHQHTPKFVSYRRKNIGWRIKVTEFGSKSSHLKMSGKAVIIDVRKFFEDLLQGIEIYKQDIKIKGEKSTLFKNLISAHRSMMTPIAKDRLIEKVKKNYKNKKRRYIKQCDFNFLKNKSI